MSSGLSPLVVIWMRIFVGFIFFYTLSKLLKINLLLQKKHYLLMFICCAGGTVLNQVCFYYGLQITSPINASILNLFNPLTIIVLSFLVLKEQISNITKIGFGIALMSSFFLIDFTNASFGSSSFWGDFLVILNAIFFGTYVIAASKLTSHYHSFAISFYMLLGGLIVISPFATPDLIETNFRIITFETWLSIAFIIIANTIIAFMLTNYLPKITSPYIMGLYVYLQPFVTSIFTLILAKDTLDFRKVICGIFVIIGIFIAQYGRKSFRNSKPEH